MIAWTRWGWLMGAVQRDAKCGMVRPRAMGRRRDGRAHRMMAKITELCRDARRDKGATHATSRSMWERTVAHGGCAGRIWGGRDALKGTAAHAWGRTWGWGT